MTRKINIFVLTFLCLLFGQMGYAGDVYGGENNNSGNSGNSVCTSEQTELVESFECYDIYFTQIDEYYCATAAHISTYWYDTYVFKDCGGTGTIDCNGVQNGTAYESNCGCIGGNTGIDECPEEVDCNGDLNGTAYLASCGCIGGNTGIDECPEEEPTDDTPPGTCQLICLGDYLVLNKELCQCEKLPRPWYYDGDGDEWHDSLFGIPTQKDSPGTGWRKTTKGEDCNDSNILITNNCYKDYFIDKDNDDYDAGKISAKEQGLYKITTKGTDCDDNNTNIHKLNKCGKCEVEPVSGSCDDCFESPVPENTRISSLFMSSRDCNVCSKTHGGTDYAVPTGTPIKSSASGVVVRSYFSNTYGNVVIIDHGISNINNDHVYTLYAHGSSCIVKQGDVVNEGDNVIFSGNTGNSTGPHLHYEIIKTSESPFNGSFFKGLDKRYGPDELKNIINKNCN
jgi:Peptidase family M23